MVLRHNNEIEQSYSCFSCMETEHAGLSHHWKKKTMDVFERDTQWVMRMKHKLEEHITKPSWQEHVVNQISNMQCSASPRATSKICHNPYKHL